MTGLQRRSRVSYNCCNNNQAVIMKSIILPSRAAAPLRIPIFGTKVRAGFPSPADDHMEAELDLNEYLIRNPPATFMLRVQGDSMTGAGIFDGDVIVVDRSLSAGHGSVVVAAVDGGLTVKRLYRRFGKTKLEAENPAYQPIVLQDGQELQIFGVVTSCIHPVK